MRKKISVIIGSDHAGYGLKEEIKNFFDKKRIKYRDVGTFSDEPVDYPDIAKAVIKDIKRSRNRKGILICGTGIGMCIAANRDKKVRAAVVYDAYSAKMS